MMVCNVVLKCRFSETVDLLVFLVYLVVSENSCGNLSFSVCPDHEM